MVQEPKWVRQKIETKQPIVFLGTTINPCMLSYFIWLPGLQYKNSLLKMEGTFFLFLYCKKNQQESIGTYQHGIFGDVAMAINILAIRKNFQLRIHAAQLVQLIVCHDIVKFLNVISGVFWPVLHRETPWITLKKPKNGHKT